MLQYARGNILESPADYIVIPVNCVGKPGKGLAREWADNATAHEVRYYLNRCAAGDMVPGGVIHVEDSKTILVATKDHWWHRSELEWIDTICENLCYLPMNYRRETVAVPKLGCGLGQLKWQDVHEIMQHHFNSSGATFVVYL